MDWFFWTTIHGLAFTVQQLIHRFVLKEEKDTISYWFIFQIIAAVSIFPFILFSRSFFALSIYSMLGALGSAFLSGVFIFLLLRSYNIIEVSEVAIISQTKVIWALFLAVFFLSESLNTNKLVGTFTIFLALSIVYFPKKIDFSHGSLLAIASTIVFSIKAVVDKFTLRFMPVPLFVFIVSMLPALFTPLISRNIFSRSRNLIKKKPIIVGAGILATISLFTIMKAVSLTEVSNVIPVAQAYNMLIILAGVFLLKEKKIIARKIIGGILVFIGVLLIKLA